MTLVDWQAVDWQTVDWQTTESHLLLNPRLQSEVTLSDLPNLPGHIWVSTSGTTSQSSLTLVALAKSALLCSAAQVNAHLQASSEDVWLCSLPQFHVGGLGILARAQLSSARVVDLPKGSWQVDEFVKCLGENGVSLCSLVPTQVYDIVQRKLCPPSSLRVVLLGGGGISQRVYQQAVELGWPLLPTYGMTEACSQVATARLSTIGESQIPTLEILPHWQARLGDDERLQLKGEALLSTYAHIGPGQAGLRRVECADPKQQGWFTTQDCVQIDDGQLKFVRRVSDSVKVSGELVNLQRLQKIWQESSELEAYVTSREDERRGNEVVIVTTTPLAEQVNQLVPAFNAQVMPFERVQQVYSFDQLPKTELGKLRRNLLAL